MKSVCIICGALFVEDIGFIEKHYWSCHNNHYGHNFIKEVDDDYERPAGEIDPGGTWNHWIDTEEDIIKYLKEVEQDVERNEDDLSL